MTERENRDILDLLASVFEPGEKARIKQTGDLVEIVEYHGDWDYTIKYLDPVMAYVSSYWPPAELHAHGRNLIPIDPDTSPIDVDG